MVGSPGQGMESTERREGFALPKDIALQQHCDPGLRTGSPSAHCEVGPGQTVGRAPCRGSERPGLPGQAPKLSTSWDQSEVPAPALPPSMPQFPHH